VLRNKGAEADVCEERDVADEVDVLIEVEIRGVLDVTDEDVADDKLNDELAKTSDDATRLPQTNDSQKVWPAKSLG
jgi:hypothetical protein